MISGLEHCDRALLVRFAENWSESMKKLARTLALLALGTVAAVTVSGAADRAPGEPIAGRDVKVGRIPPNNGAIVAEGTTDAQGVVRFADLPKGQYLVRIAVDGATVDVEADDAGQPIELAGAATAMDTRAAKPKPQEPRKFAKAVGGNTAKLEIGDNWLKVTLVRGAPISTSRSNIK
ncbi:MAG: hypothetical protein MUE90_03205 [Thermoanaerobaculales bacterium]|nr:hypothetical protein [Thermoanaerobaculales bacterium]